jgi:Skp family chaperone for outer membrane proteins
VLDVKKSLLCALLVAGAVALGQGAGKASAQSAAAGGTNVAVIDISYIFKHHNRFNANQEAMKKEVAGFEKYLQDERGRMQKLAERMKEFETGSPDYKKIDEEMARITAEVQVETQRKRKEFLEQEAKLYNNTYNEIVDEVTRFARQHGIALVLRFSSEAINPDDRQSVLQGVNRSVVYQDRLNITDIILQQINRNGPPPQKTVTPVIPRTQTGVPR